MALFQKLNFLQVGFPITLFPKFASRMDEDSVKESSTILDVSDSVSLQETTLQVKICWQTFVIQVQVRLKSTFDRVRPTLERATGLQAAFLSTQTQTPPICHSSSFLPISS